MACSGNKLKFIEKKSPMQSHSQRDSEKLFVIKFLFETTFIFHFTSYLTLFSSQNFLYIYERKNPLSKNKAIYLVKCCSHFSSPKYSSHTSETLKNSTPKRLGKRTQWKQI